MKPLFITGIGTGIGKTVVSAVITEKLGAAYWKPIQSGDLDYTDTDRVKSLISNPLSVFYSEAYRLTAPFSPHKSAAIDGITIMPGQIRLPQTERPLVIEGAGGLMVPLNQTDLMIDLIKMLGAEVVLVSKNYLGSINHTLLSLEVLAARNIPVHTLVFNGASDQYTEDIICSRCNVRQVKRIPEFDTLTKENISKAAAALDWN